MEANDADGHAWASQTERDCFIIHVFMSKLASPSLQMETECSHE